jgi:PRTRC genetic system ThiF family protein
MRKKVITAAAGATVLKPKKIVHYTAEYIINPPHPVTINVIGCGGTGSQVLASLARMHSALIALGHPGFFVRAIDPDKVSPANMGRQLFSSSDIDSFKCMVLIGRINRFFGTDWEGIPELYDTNSQHMANITISCVDSGPARKEIKNRLLAAITPIKIDRDERRTSVRWVQNRPRLEPYEQPYYWMDYGNMMDRGQVVIGSIRDIKQPEKSEHDCRSALQTIDKIHPDIFNKGKGDQGPSCSLAEALHKQDLFINTNLANMGLGILWKMFRELHIEYNGLYVNLKNLSVNPIKI